MGPDAVPCYGRNMPFADRMDHESPDFYNALERDVEYLNAKNPVGFAIRLHELGDFFSLNYVSFCDMLLCSYPALNAFGYSHTTGGRSITTRHAVYMLRHGRTATLRHLRLRRHPRHWHSPDNLNHQALV